MLNPLLYVADKSTLGIYFIMPDRADTLGFLNGTARSMNLFALVIKLLFKLLDLLQNSITSPKNS